MKIHCIIICVLLLTGCGHIQSIGQIGGKKFYTVKVPGLIVPSQAAIIMQDSVNTNDIVVVNSANGPGLGNAAVGAGGNIGAALLWGRSLRPDQINVSSTAGGAESSSSSDSSSISKAASTGGSPKTMSAGKPKKMKPPKHSQD